MTPCGTRRVLSSAAAAAASARTSRAALEARVRLLAQVPEERVSLAHFAFVAPSEQTRLISARFLRRELPGRVAKRIRDLERLPFGLDQHERVRTVVDWFYEAFRRLDEAAQVEDTAGHDQYVEELKFLILQHQSVVHMVSTAVQSINFRSVELQNRFLLQEHLDNFYRERLALRLLAAQHIAIQERVGIGLVDHQCDARAALERGVADAAAIVRRLFGRVPEVRIEGEVQPFRYVPTHLRYLLFECVKNSMRMTARRFEHEPDSPLPPIDVHLSSTASQVSFKFQDQGGGFPRSDLPILWSHLSRDELAVDERRDHDVHVGCEASADADVDDRALLVDDISRAPLGSLAKLPIVRLYARFFGGNLKLFPLYGRGLDTHLFLTPISQQNKHIEI